MTLLVSHYTQNRGTTDFLIEYFKGKGKRYFYLKHPFSSEGMKYSELFYFNGEQEKRISKFRKINNRLLVLVEDFLINIFVSIKFGKKINKVISFGGFNFVPYVFLNSLFKRQLYFWGCDYSSRRFGNFIFDKLYFIFENIACKNAHKVIQPTPRQESVRIKKHKLNPKKSIIVPNGIDQVSLGRQRVEKKKISLIYIGSITKQHGITDFVKFFYVQKRINFKLYIFGSGEDSFDLKKIIEKNNLSEQAIYFGPKNGKDIKKFIFNSNDNFFGIAPYDMKKNDHVYYGDSIKIKEYLSYDIPFIASRVAYVYSDIKKFGFVYDNFEDLNNFFNKSIYNFQFNKIEKDGILQNYLWRNLFDKLYPYLS